MSTATKSSPNTGQMCLDLPMCEMSEQQTWSELTSCVGGSPVRMCHSLDSEQDLEENGQHFGLSSTESFARLGPDGCWLKTYQGCYQAMMDGSWETFSGTWPRAGTMRNGTVYQQQPLVHRISGSGCSWWLTPTVITGEHPGRVKIKPGQQDCLSAQVNRTPSDRRWPTPRAADWKGAVSPTDCTRRLAIGDANLPEAVQESERPNGGQLNPPFVEYLMNFPKGWTDLTE